MKWLQQFGVLFLSTWLITACGEDKSTPTTPAATTVVDPTEPTQAQSKLRTMKLWIGAQSMDTEIARTENEMRTGMMFRKTMGENDGMLFVFDRPHQTSFWMKNTQVPLSAAYIDPQGNILEIHDLKPLDTNAVTATSANIQFVLEVSQGWFDKHQIKPGTAIRTETGTLLSTFFR